MNICDERHEPNCLVTYKGAKGSNYHPIWLVCESCMDMNHFGATDQIESMDILLNMTNDVVMKIKQQINRPSEIS